MLHYIELQSIIILFITSNILYHIISHYIILVYMVLFDII